MAKAHFSGEQEKLLIELIRKNAELFDLSHEKYKDTNHKDEIWQDISNAIGKSVDDCKRKWKYIRDSHNRCKRKLGTRSARSVKKKLPSAERVSFLNTVENKRISACNMASQNEKNNIAIDDIDRSIGNEITLQDEDSTGCSFEEKQDEQIESRYSLVEKRASRSKLDKLAILLGKRTEERNKAIKKNEEQNKLILNADKHVDDDIDLFFKSLAMTVKKLPKMAINEAKMKSLIMVNELEEKYNTY